MIILSTRESPPYFEWKFHGFEVDNYKNETNITSISLLLEF